MYTPSLENIQSELLRQFDSVYLFSDTLSLPQASSLLTVLVSREATPTPSRTVVYLPDDYLDEVERRLENYGRRAGEIDSFALRRLGHEEAGLPDEQEWLRSRSKYDNISGKALIICQSRIFLQEIRNLANIKTPYSDKLWTLSMDEQGNLYNPFDEEHSNVAAYLAARKLGNIVEDRVLYIDTETLKERESKNFLQYVKTPLLQYKKQLAVLVNKTEKLPHADLLIARAQEKPSTVRFVYLNADLPYTNALTDAILRDVQNNGFTDIALISNQSDKGARVACAVQDGGVNAIQYRINKYGFISSADTRTTKLNRSFRFNRERRQSELELAIEQGDTEKALKFIGNIRDSQDIEASIIAALRHRNDDILTFLIQRLDKSRGQALHWWVEEYTPFVSPHYLEKNPLHMELLETLIGKVTNRSLLRSVLSMLQDVAELPQSSKEYLAQLIHLVRKKTKVTSEKEERKPSEQDAIGNIYSLISSLQDMVHRAGLSREESGKLLTAFLLLRYVYDTKSEHVRERAQWKREANKSDEFIERWLYFADTLSPMLNGILRGLRFFERLVHLPHDIFLAFHNILVSPMWDMSAGLVSHAAFCSVINTIQEHGRNGEWATKAQTYSEADIAALLAELLLPTEDTPSQEEMRIFDPAIGSGVMLRALRDRAKEICPERPCRLFGQDINEEALAEAQVQLLLDGEASAKLFCEDYLAEDIFMQTKFTHIVVQPPFSYTVSTNAALEKEFKKGLRGRFPVGGTGKQKAELLFLQAALSKLTHGGKIGILLRTGTLFDRGDRNVRRYIVEHDLLDAIIMLPGKLISSTAIPTCIWILNTAKPANRAGRIQLIDASHCYKNAEKRRGSKLVDIDESARNLILQAYREYQEAGLYGDPRDMCCHSRLVSVSELLNHQNVNDNFIIPFANYFYENKSGETMETAIPKDISNLLAHLEVLKEERAQRVKKLDEKIRSCEERIKELKIVAQHSGISLSEFRDQLLRIR